MNLLSSLNRREFFAAGAATGCGLASPQLANAGDTLNGTLIRGKAEHVISIWLGGGMGQIDTFDPKGKGDPSKKLAGSYYNSIETAVPDVRVCEHLPKLARLMARVTAVRSVHHEVINAASRSRVSVGSCVSRSMFSPSVTPVTEANGHWAGTD